MTNTTLALPYKWGSYSTGCVHFDIHENYDHWPCILACSSCQYRTACTVFTCTTGQTTCTVCLQFITINSLYMFKALICSTSGGNVYTTNGIFCAYYEGWLLAGLEWTLLAASRYNIHKIYQLLYTERLLMIST
jgi:hypothetical protein